MNSADQQRMDFMLARDGIDGAIRFAEQAKLVYKKAVIESRQQHGKRGYYRRAYIESYLFHKRYLEKHYAL